MKLLLLNTCGPEGSFALSDKSLPDRVRLVSMPGRSASELLVGLLREAMMEAIWKTTEIDAIAVVTGPGSFTGVRVGLSAAKGLSEASGVPLIAVSRLELLAAKAQKTEPRTICALLDAGRGEFYCGTYRDGEPLGEALLSLEEAIGRGSGVDEIVVCEDVVEKAMSGRLTVSRVLEPTAGDALPIAMKRFQQGEFADTATLDANYLRRTDAEIFASSPKPRAG